MGKAALPRPTAPRTVEAKERAARREPDATSKLRRDDQRILYPVCALERDVEAYLTRLVHVEGDRSSIAGHPDPTGCGRQGSRGERQVDGHRQLPSTSPSPPPLQHGRGPLAFTQEPHAPASRFSPEPNHPAPNDLGGWELGRGGQASSRVRGPEFGPGPLEPAGAARPPPVQGGEHIAASPRAPQHLHRRVDLDALDDASVGAQAKERVAGPVSGPEGRPPLLSLRAGPEDALDSSRPQVTRGQTPAETADGHGEGPQVPSAQLGAVHPPWTDEDPPGDAGTLWRFSPSRRPWAAAATPAAD